MADQVIWSKCNVFAEDGTRTTLKRGQFVPDFVDFPQLDRLRVVGAIQAVETVPVPAAEPAPIAEPVTEPLAKPSAGDAKDAWVAYATDARNPNRLSADDVATMSKAAIMERFSG